MSRQRWWRYAERALGAMGAAYGVAVVAWLAASALLRSRPWPVVLADDLAFWLLLPAPALLAAAAVRRARLLALAVAPALVALLAGYGPRFLPRRHPASPAPAPAGPLRVLAFNVLGGSREESGIA